MERFTKQNLQHIQQIFEAKTGVNIHPRRQKHPILLRKIAVMAAMIALCGILMAAAYPLFSPLEGDQLSLTGHYEGNGIAAITVINGSEKKLVFQEQLKLMSWQDGEVEPLDGKVIFENTVFEPHSSGTMTVDLSQAYPMAQIEKEAVSNKYYLVLTNQDFLFGHDWTCSFLFNTAPAEPEDATEPEADPIAAQSYEEIEPSLQFYFADHYLDEIPSWNPANTQYLEKVQSLLREQTGYFVHSVDPLLLVDDPMKELADGSLVKDDGYPWVMQNHHTLDSFNRIVGSMFPGNGQDCALPLGVPIPQYQGETDGGNGGFYVRYFFTYPTAERKREDAYTFISGRILDFEEMAPYLVYEDEQYTVYDMTHLFFTDLDAYLDDFLAAYNEITYMDEQVRESIHKVYDYYGDKEKISFHYVIDPNA